jgi:hypothetical protein
MAEANWTFCNDGLSIGAVDRGVTNGIARPNGGGNFVFGFNSLGTSIGAVALFTNQTNFAPTAANKGGSVRGAVKRGVSGGAAGFAPFLFVGLQGPSVNDSSYILGLSDDDPHRISLRKGSLVSGVPSGSPGTNQILRRSAATFANDTWLHLRLDMIVNLTGDVILKCWRSDLDAHLVSSPVWVAETGLEDFVDDALGINSGSAPFTSGRLGFGFYTRDVTRRGFVDNLECLRQL